MEHGDATATVIGGADPWASFCDHLAGSLADNNMLRGIWAESVVLHFLDEPWRLSKAWDYYDLCRSRDAGPPVTLSVKQSCSTSPRFGVGRKRYAWDGELMVTDGDGWLPADEGGARHWCDVYVFAWIDGAPTVERVRDPQWWTFLVGDRRSMDRFPEESRTAGISTLRDQLGAEPITGRDLRAAVDAVVARL